jgi:hypothetical protein
MKIILSFLFIITFVNYISASFSEWSQTTKYGNRFNNFNGLEIVTKNNESISIAKFYFYKNHIIAKIENSNNFVDIDEISGKIIFFEKNSSYLKKHKLIPKYWTRWFDENWDDYPKKGFLIKYLIYFIFTIPFTIFWIFTLYKAIKNEKFKYFKIYTTLWTIMSLIVFTDIILDKFPSSI